jgi:hypothetical protein
MGCGQTPARTGPDPDFRQAATARKTCREAGGVDEGELPGGTVTICTVPVAAPKLSPAIVSCVPQAAGPLSGIRLVIAGQNPHDRPWKNPGRKPPRAPRVLAVIATPIGWTVRRSGQSMPR